jgi:ElaB/YqjD/DUF883 family membrane-anchored ribosome-binding protein
MAGPHDDPTRRLQPSVPPPPPEGTYRETVYAEPDPEASPPALLERLRALQRWVAVLGALSLIALGVGLYALLAEDEEGRGDGRGASRQSVRDLRERVETVEDEVRDRATKNSVSSLREQQEALDDRVGEVSEQASGDTGGAEEAQQAAEELQNDIQALEQRIEAVEQNAGDDGGDTGDTGSP